MLCSRTVKELVLVLFFLVSLQLVKCTGDFESVPTYIKIFENETALLPCYLTNKEEGIRIRWWKDGSLLGDNWNPHQLLPPRVRLWANHSLEVAGLQSQDTGDYTCEVIRRQPWTSINQTHSIQVQYSPKIQTIPEDGFLEVKRNEYVHIGCVVDGTPDPVVSWRKNGEPLQIVEGNRTRLKFKAEHRLLSGVYECVADNGVGLPVKGVIKVVVQDAPVVRATQSWIHTAPAYRAVLEAIVEYSVPSPKTHWLKDGKPVATNERIFMAINDNVHQLVIRNVRQSDLGNYTFRAENPLGMADVSFKLTGVPHIASFRVDDALNKPEPTSFTLHWQVESNMPILEYHLFLRPYTARTSDDPDAPQIPWRRIVVPSSFYDDAPVHTASYTVHGLTPSTVYEAMVTSRNQYGWSQYSAVLHFATEPGSSPPRFTAIPVVCGSTDLRKFRLIIYKQPSTSDYKELATPILIEEPIIPSGVNASGLYEQQKSSTNCLFPSFLLVTFTIIMMRRLCTFRL